MNKEFSDKLAVVKLITSSLFARKQPYMVINGHTPGVFLYTNIAHDRVALYRSEVDDVLSKVIIKEPTVISAIFDSFPILKDAIVELNLKDFSSALNRALNCKKEVFPPLQFNKCGPGSVSVLIDPTPGADGDHDVVSIPVGRILTENDPEFYEDIISNYEKFSDNIVKRQFRATQQVDGDDLSLEIVEVSGKEKDPNLEFALPVKDGISMVSAREYVRRRNLDPMYDLLLRVNPTGRTTKATILYSDDWLDAFTIMPGSLWFMSPLGL